MALIRSYSQIEERRLAGELTPAEEQLLDECRSGELVELGDGTRPDHASPEWTLRADLLRYLILGGCEAFRTHEHGVLVKGAWIDGHLDLAFTTARGATLLRNCVFSEEIDATQARLQRLDLEGSRLTGLSANYCHVAGDVWLDRVEPSGPVLLVGATIGGQLSCKGSRLDSGGGTVLNAQGARVSGGVFLRELISTGEVSFANATVGGQLACEGAKLCGVGGDALNAQGAHVTGDVFLRDVTSTGAVRFSGATIGGQMDCGSARLDGGGGKALNAQGARVSDDVFLCELTSAGDVDFSGAAIDGQLVCEGATLGGSGGKALSAQRLRVKEGFFWRELASVIGEVSLDSAYVGDLVDDRESWEKTDALNLVGLTYDNLIGPLDEEMRLAWLRKGAKPNGAFHPQPYQQLAKVLHASGHRAEARAILIEKERDQRRAARERALDGVFGFSRRALVHAEYLPHRVWSWLIGWATGYGYAPWRIIWPLLILIALQAELARNTWNAGDFAPNSDVVLVSDGWTEIANAPGGQALDANCLREGGGEPCLSLPGLSVNAAAIWSSPTGAGRDYETFNALSYAVDVVLPLVELGQEAAWAPSPARGWLGWFAHHAQKVFVILGWIVAAIFAGAVTGIIRRDD